MLLTDLPEDLLVALPDYLESIDDLYSLLQSCRALYVTCSTTKARLQPHLRRRDGQYLLQPHPHLLVAGTARQVADCAVQCVENRDALHAALMRGLDDLLDLCVSVARVSLGDMRELHRIKYEILNPLSKLLDLEAGPATRERGLKAFEQADLCILNHWIYCDLFHHAITAAYRRIDVPVQITDAIRLDYLKYCVPDENCRKVDLSVEFSGLGAEAQRAIAYQQLDLSQLFAETGYSRIPEHLDIDTYSDEADRYPWIVLQHRGLQTMRFALAHHPLAPEKLLTPYRDATIDPEMRELTQAVQSSREDVEVNADEEDTSVEWQSMMTDIYEVW